MLFNSKAEQLPLHVLLRAGTTVPLLLSGKSPHSCWGYKATKNDQVIKSSCVCTCVCNYICVSIYLSLNWPLKQSMDCFLPRLPPIFYLLLCHVAATLLSVCDSNHISPYLIPLLWTINWGKSSNLCYFGGFY